METLCDAVPSQVALQPCAASLGHTGLVVRFGSVELVPVEGLAAPSLGSTLS